jgi:hypothetical protein
LRKKKVAGSLLKRDGSFNSSIISAMIVTHGLQKNTSTRAPTPTVDALLQARQGTVTAQPEASTIHGHECSRLLSMVVSQTPQRTINDA